MNIKIYKLISLVCLLLITHLGPTEGDVEVFAPPGSLPDLVHVTLGCHPPPLLVLMLWVSLRCGGILPDMIMRFC